MARPRWSYRLVRTGEGLAFREVFYGENGEVICISETDAKPVGRSVGELVDDLMRMINCCVLPVLEPTKAGEKT